MTDHAATAPARLATRLAFFAAGFAVSAWAPLIPYAKANVGADAAEFGLLLADARDRLALRDADHGMGLGPLRRAPDDPLRRFRAGDASAAVSRLPGSR